MLASGQRWLEKLSLATYRDFPRASSQHAQPEKRGLVLQLKDSFDGFISSVT